MEEKKIRVTIFMGNQSLQAYFNSLEKLKEKAKQLGASYVCLREVFLGGGRKYLVGEMPQSFLAEGAEIQLLSAGYPKH